MGEYLIGWSPHPMIRRSIERHGIVLEEEIKRRNKT